MYHVHQFWLAKDALRFVLYSQLVALAVKKYILSDVLRAENNGETNISKPGWKPAEWSVFGAVYSEPWNSERSQPQTCSVCVWERRQVANGRQNFVTIYECLLPISEKQTEAGILSGLPWRYCIRF